MAQVGIEVVPGDHRGRHGWRGSRFAKRRKGRTWQFESGHPGVAECLSNFLLEPEGVGV